MRRWLRPLVAVLCAAVVWNVGMLAVQMVSYQFATLPQMESTSGLVAWISVPQLIMAFLMVLVAGLVYGRRHLPSVRGALVVLGFPVAQVVYVTITGVVGGAETAVIIVRALAGAAGMAAGWGLLVLWRGKRPAEPWV